MKIIAGLATAIAFTGAAGTAFADDARTRTVPKTAAAGGATTTQAQAQAPQPKLAQSSAAAGDASSRNSAKSFSQSAASYRDCYVYSSGAGDLCSWWNWNYSQSRGGVYYGDSNWVDNYFVTYGSGQYSTMNNNSLSVYNYDSYLTAKVYTYANFSGAVGALKPKYGGNYNSTFALNVSSNSWS